MENISCQKEKNYHIKRLRTTTYKLKANYVFIVFTFLLSAHTTFSQYWEPIPDSPINVERMICDADGNLWVGTSTGDVYSYNGTIWENKGRASQGNITSIAIAPNGDIYVAYLTNSYLIYLYKSTNGGTNWDIVFPATNIIEEIVISSSGEVYFGTYNAIYVPYNGSWRRASTDGVYGYVGAPLALAPNGTLYAIERTQELTDSSSSYRFYIVRSTDFGNSWLRCSDSSEVEIYRLTVVDNNTIFVAASDSGILKSTDVGQNWTRCDSILPDITVAFDIIYNPTREELVAHIDNYTPVNCDVLMSTDLGESWELQNSGLPRDPYQIMVGSYSFAFNNKSYYLRLSSDSGRVYRYVPGVAELNIDTDLLDFGDIRVGDSSTKTVTITNSGTATLVISSFDISPNVFTLPNCETTIKIQPGDHYDLAVQFSPTIDTSYNGSITFTHNSNNVPNSITRKLLTGRGITNSGYYLTRKDFGNVIVGTPSTDFVRLTNTGGATLIISSVYIAEGVFSLPNNETTVTIYPNEPYEFYIQFSPMDTIDYIDSMILVHNGEYSPSIIILTGRGVAPNIALNPSDIINFDDVLINSYRIENMTIKNNGTADLIITEVSINGAGFTLPNNENITVSLQRPIIVTAGDSCTITVQFLPTEAGYHNGTVILTHNVADGSNTIELTGRGVQNNVVIDPTSINFGDVLINSSRTENITIKNNGTADLIITEVSINGAGFTLPNNENISVSLQSPITITAGDSLTITVQFLPIATGDYIDTLTLTHNMSASPSMIQLTGRGISIVRVSIKDNYTVKPNETIPISVDVIDDLTDRNVKDFLFTLKYNKRILSYKGVNSTLSNVLISDTTGSIYGELVVKVTNSTGTPLVGTGTSKLIEFNFLGLIGDSCGTHLILESFKFNSDGPMAIIENGYCELFGRCGGEQTYVTTELPILFQNNPNPIREGYESTIQYRITTAGQTNLTVYDILGKEVAKLVNEYKSEGLYSVSFNTKGLSSGVYFYRLRAPGYEGLKKMVVIK